MGLLSTWTSPQDMETFATSGGVLARSVYTNAARVPRNGEGTLLERSPVAKQLFIPTANSLVPTDQ